METSLVFHVRLVGLYTVIHPADFNVKVLIELRNATAFWLVYAENTGHTFWKVDEVAGKSVICGHNFLVENTNEVGNIYFAVISLLYFDFD